MVVQTFRALKIERDGISFPKLWRLLAPSSGEILETMNRSRPCPQIQFKGRGKAREREDQTELCSLASNVLPCPLPRSDLLLSSPPLLKRVTFPRTSPNNKKGRRESPINGLKREQAALLREDKNNGRLLGYLFITGGEQQPNLSRKKRRRDPRAKDKRTAGDSLNFRPVHYSIYNSKWERPERTAARGQGDHLFEPLSTPVCRTNPFLDLLFG